MFSNTKKYIYLVWLNCSKVKWNFFSSFYDNYIVSTITTWLFWQSFHFLCQKHRKDMKFTLTHTDTHSKSAFDCQSRNIAPNFTPSSQITDHEEAVVSWANHWLTNDGREQIWVEKMERKKNLSCQQRLGNYGDMRLYTHHFRTFCYHPENPNLLSSSFWLCCPTSSLKCSWRSFWLYVWGFLNICAHTHTQHEEALFMKNHNLW